MASVAGAATVPANSMADPAKNAGIATVEWFTTRMYLAGAVDPVAVSAPC